MAKAKRAEESVAKPFATTLIGWLGIGLSMVVAVACVALALWGAGQGRAGGTKLLYGLLFLPVSVLGWALFRDFLGLKDWAAAPEVPLGVKLLGHLGRILGTLALASCVAFCILTIAVPQSVPPLPVKPAGEPTPPGAPAPAAEVTQGAPRPLLAAVYVLGVFVSILVRVLGSAISELRTWARPGSLVATGLAVAFLIVALIFNLTKWMVAEANLAIPLFLGFSVVMFLFLLVYFTLPPVVEAFESRRL